MNLRGGATASKWKGVMDSPSSLYTYSFLILFKKCCINFKNYTQSFK